MNPRRLREPTRQRAAVAWLVCKRAGLCRDLRKIIGRLLHPQWQRDYTWEMHQQRMWWTAQGPVVRPWREGYSAFDPRQQVIRHIRAVVSEPSAYPWKHCDRRKFPLPKRIK